MSYKVIIDDISPEDWEQYAAGFADYSIYQTWAYQKVRGETDGQSISRAIIKSENGSVLTMCQVRIKYIMGLRIGYVQWGPLVRGNNGMLGISTSALEVLRKAYVGTKVNILRVIPNVCDDETGKRLSKKLLSCGFKHVASSSPYRTFMVRTDDSEEGIRQRLRKSFRRDVKKAEKTGLEIREGHGDKFCKILGVLYVELLSRKGFKGLKPQEFTAVQNSLSSGEEMNIIVAYLDGEPVSALLASNLGDTSVVLLAASNQRGLECGSSYLVWYQGALSALRCGMKRYDLGGIDPRNNPHVYQFKSRMGGEEVQYIGAYDAYSSIRIESIWRVAEKIYNFVRNKK